MIGGANANNDLSVASNQGDTVAFAGSLDLTLVANSSTGSMTGIETLSMQDALTGGPGHDSLKLNSGDIIALGTGTFDPAGSLSSQHAVRIDGDTERLTGTGIPAGSKAIVLNGDGAGATADGLVLATGSGGSEVKGLAIRDFQCATAAPDPCASGFGL